MQRLFLSKPFLILLFLGLLAMRLLHLQADPPPNVSRNARLLAEEVLDAQHVRHQIVFGPSDLWDNADDSPLTTWIQSLVFRGLGLGRVQLRLISVLFSMIALWLLYLAASNSYGKTTGLLVLLLLGANYVYLMHNRLGLQENYILTLFVITFYLWQKGMDMLSMNRGWSWYFFLAGACGFGTATLSKASLVLLPVPFVALASYLGIHARNKLLRNQLFQALVSLSIGTGAAFAAWVAATYLTYDQNIAGIRKHLPDMLFRGMEGHHPLRNLYQTPFFQYVSPNRIVLAGTFLFLIYLGYLFCSERRVHIHPTDVFLAIWFVMAFIFLGLRSPCPAYWFLPIIPPMGIFTARLITGIHDTHYLPLSRTLHWSFSLLSGILITVLVYYVSTPHAQITRSGFREAVHARNALLGLLSAILFTGSILWFTKKGTHRSLRFPRLCSIAVSGVLAISSLVTDGYHYYQWARSPRYSVRDAGRDLQNYLGNTAYIGGFAAPAIAFETPYQIRYVQAGGLPPQEHPFRQAQLTHLLLGESDDMHEQRYYFQTYPENMSGATLLQQYALNGTMVSLFSLVEPQIEQLAPNDRIFLPGERLHVKIRVKNQDFRQTRKLLLHWFLYPEATTMNANMVSVSSVQIEQWLPPNHKEAVIVSGKLPDQPGSYRLLAALSDLKTVRYEAENLEHRIGNVVKDLKAMGNQAVYHNVKASPTADFLVFGGEYRYLRPGFYEAVFRLKIADQMRYDPLVRLEVAVRDGAALLAQQNVRGVDVPDAWRYFNVTIPFMVTEGADRAEFRVFSYAKTDVWVDEVRMVFQEGRWYDEPLTIHTEDTSVPRDISLESIELQKTTVAPGEAMNIRLSLNNRDTTEKRFSLNWFLFPETLEEEAQPASISQKVEASLFSGQLQEFVVPGKFPDQPGQYDLLASWYPLEEVHYEAETMRRQIGQIVEDPQALEKQAVYHQSSAEPGAGLLTYGRYRDYDPGIYEAIFILKIKDNTIADKVVRIEAVADESRQVLRQISLRGTDFNTAHRYQGFILPYMLKEFTPNVEFRIFSYGATDVWADGIHIMFRKGVWYKTPLIVR